METRHSVVGSFGGELPATKNNCWVLAAWSRKTLTTLEKFLCVLGKRPLTVKFLKSVPKVFIATPTDVLYLNFVKLGRQEMADIVRTVRCLPVKKQQYFAWLSSSCYWADCAQNLPGLALDNVLRVLQISSNSVHVRRSYSRTREHSHKNAP